MVRRCEPLDTPQIAGAHLPPGEDPQTLLAAITPWLAEASQTRKACLRHGPGGAAPANQRSCLLVPLIAHKHLLGYLYADVEGHLGRLDEVHLDLLSTLAAQGGARRRHDLGGARGQRGVQ